MRSGKGQAGLGRGWNDSIVMWGPDHLQLSPGGQQGDCPPPSVPPGAGNGEAGAGRELGWREEGVSGGWGGCEVGRWGTYEAKQVRVRSAEGRGPGSGSSSCPAESSCNHWYPLGNMMTNAMAMAWQMKTLF